MRTLLFACLLVAGPVGATIEYVDDNKSESCPSNARCETWYTVTKKQHGCLARMEEAMKAMDEFMAHGLWPTDQRDIPAKARALVLWHDAKRQCWANAGG